MSDVTVPWLIFYGTHLALVMAVSPADAYGRFIVENFPQSKFGRIIPPTLDEIRIREIAETDRDWIMESESPEFIAALAHLTGAR